MDCCFQAKPLQIRQSGSSNDHIPVSRELRRVPFLLTRRSRKSQIQAFEHRNDRGSDFQTRKPFMIARNHQNLLKGTDPMDISCQQVTRFVFELETLRVRRIEVLQAKGIALGHAIRLN